jgi:methionine-rich copper-binding protein CopC
MVLAVVVMVGEFGFAAPAQAHPTLLLTSPAAYIAAATSPSVLVLVFNEPVSIGRQAMTVTNTAAARSVSTRWPPRAAAPH